MINGKLLEHFWQQGIDQLDMEDVLITSFVIIDDLYKRYVPDYAPYRRDPDSPFPDSKVSLFILSLALNFAPNFALNFAPNFALNLALNLALSFALSFA